MSFFRLWLTGYLHSRGTLLRLREVLHLARGPGRDDPGSGRYPTGSPAVVRTGPLQGSVCSAEGRNILIGSTYSL